MDIEETKIYAAQEVMRQLCTGKDFNGLGALAQGLITSVASSADENAKLSYQNTTRTSEKFLAMRDRVRDQFVMNVLGFTRHGRDRMSPMEAAAYLVEQVFDSYYSWAHEAQA